MLCDLLNVIRNHIGYKKYAFKKWAYRWVQDESGDIGIKVFGLVTLLKYKEHTVVYWSNKLPLRPAGKWQGHVDPGQQG